MTKRRTQKTRLQKSFDDLEVRQQNITWPNYVSNARSVDGYLFKGSRDAPLVQRIGAWLFGLTFILGAVGFLFVGFPDFLTRLISTAMLLLAVHIFLVGCRRRKKPRQD